MCLSAKALRLTHFDGELSWRTLTWYWVNEYAATVGM